MLCQYFIIVYIVGNRKKNLYIQAQVSICTGNNLEKLVCTVITGHTNKLMMEVFILKKAC